MKKSPPGTWNLIDSTVLPSSPNLQIDIPRDFRRGRKMQLHVHHHLAIRLSLPAPGILALLPRISRLPHQKEPLRRGPQGPLPCTWHRRRRLTKKWNGLNRICISVRKLPRQQQLKDPVFISVLGGPKELIPPSTQGATYR